MSIATARIEALASDVLIDAFGSIDEISPPVDLKKVLDKTGISVEVGNFKNPEVSGLFDPSQNKVYVSAKDGYPRQAFTIAHELGHYYLHNKSGDVLLRTYALQPELQKKPEEQEANWFAASLLMPRQLVESYWSVTHSIDDIASIFGVSRSAVWWRLKNLGLLENGDSMDGIQ